MNATPRNLVGLFVLVLGSCHQDPACRPGKATERDADCVHQAVDDCRGSPGERACLTRWKVTCQLERELAVARCTR